MPPLKACTDIAGTFTAQAAAANGPGAGTPVITGCLDAAAGALGRGHAPRPDDRSGGTGGRHGAQRGSCDGRPAPDLLPSCLAGPVSVAERHSGRRSLGWFRDILGHDGDVGNPFELFSAEVAQTKPGAGGLIFVPYMAGERTPVWSSTARGVFFGLLLLNHEGGYAARHHGRVRFRCLR